MPCRRALLHFAAALLTAWPLHLAAQTLACAPCAGLRASEPEGAAALAAALGGQAELAPGTAVFVAWDVPLDGREETAGRTAAAAAAVRRAGATPWIALLFTAPAPLLENPSRLDAEVAAAAGIARRAGAAFYQVVWRPEAGTAGAAGDYPYLLKRAAVAVTGAEEGARLATGPLDPEPAALDRLYAGEVGGYLEAVAVVPAPPERLTAFAAALAGHDPGRPLVVDAVPLPAEPLEALAVAAAGAVAGAPVTLFTVGAGADPRAAALPLAVLAREFTGDLAYDPHSTPSGADAWTFVRGSDLGLRVIARTPRAAGGEPVEELALTFPDPQLRRPHRVEPAGGEAIPLAGARRTAAGLVVRVADPGPVAVLRLERAGVEELGEGGGLEERVEVASERQVPVEEILRRLQAFEDAHARRIDNYSATNTTHLRFGVGAGAQSFEATFQGPYFFDPATGADWAWQTLFVNGVRWRGRNIPEIPLVQPEKAAAMPLEITFDKTYRYHLRGTEAVAGRDAWVVDFAPAAAADAPAADGVAAGGPGGRSLYRGTVWIDRALSARVRTRAVQLGLEGEVISNEETLEYRPVTAGGEEAPWETGSFVLPLRVVSQQLLSVVNATTLVERETLLTELTINGEDFAARRAAVTASDVTMVRDTEAGLRYLVHEEGVEGRVVKEGFDTDKWFIAGGVFWDDALDYPLPLGGIDYLDLDFRDRGAQLNVFFAGALLTANLAQPRLGGSRFDAGADLFAIAVPLADTVYRAGEEVAAEEVEVRPASLGLKVGRPLGSFVKLSGEYRLLRRDFGRTDETAADFLLPEDHLEHALSLRSRFVRSGYSLGLDVGYSRRSAWEDWGAAGAVVDAEASRDFLYWGASLGKNWYLPRFQKIGAELAYVDGRDLDRFSKYEFGFFGRTRVHGYQSNRVRAQRAVAVHGSYGFEIGELLRLDALADVAWATDEETGLAEEMLAGVGIAGSFVGPFQTLVNLDLGVPVAGPDDGFVAYVVFLKLFR
jgi:hypothetical protein